MSGCAIPIFLCVLASLFVLMSFIQEVYFLKQTYICLKIKVLYDEQ